MRRVVKLFFLVIGLMCGCKVHYKAVSFQDTNYKINTIQTDSLSEIEQFLKPYRDSLQLQMNRVIGSAVADFKKEKPSGSLGHLVCDAMMDKAKQMQWSADAAIYNYGGLRINELKKGNITVGKIYELLPFENELVLINIDGRTLKTWLNFICKSGGWPISESLNLNEMQSQSKYKIRKMADNMLQYETIQDTVKYQILTNDYIAGGGDNCDFLKDLPKENSGVLVRELLIDFIEKSVIITPDSKSRIKLNK